MTRPAVLWTCLACETDYYHGDPADEDGCGFCGWRQEEL